jgi:hypothetical protein
MKALVISTRSAMARRHDRERACIGLANEAESGQSIECPERPQSSGQRQSFAHDGIFFPVGCRNGTHGHGHDALDGSADGVVGRRNIESNDRFAAPPKTGVRSTVGHEDQSVRELVNRNHSANGHSLTLPDGVCGTAKLDCRSSRCRSTFRAACCH